MIFKSLTELADYLIENDINVNDLEINLSSEVEQPIDESTETFVENENMLIESVNVSSLGDDPSVKFEVADIPVNELHVTKFDVLKDACGAGNIKLCESDVYLNICNMEDKTTTKMSITVNGNKYADMELSLKESTEEKIVLSQEWVNSNISSEVTL